MKKLLKLLEKLEKLNLPKDKFAIYGSGPLGIRDIREINDLDLIVTPDLWKKLSKIYSIKGPDNERKIRIGEIEIVGNTILYEAEKMIKEADVVDGIRYVNLETLMKCKKKMGRKKDLKDIKLIKNYLKNLALRGHPSKS